MADNLDPAQQRFVQLLKENARRFRPYEVFNDFCEMAAISLSNAVDKTHYPQREARYMEIVGRYQPEEVERFPKMLACIVDSLSAGLSDCLGQLFMALDFGGSWQGQFFTPYSISRLIAGLTFSGAAERIAERGYITVSDPAVGAGALVIAGADALQHANINYQKCMHATVTDIDAIAVHMCYVQLALLHIPAFVIHGNSLTLEQVAVWRTPAHCLGGWEYRLQREQAAPVPSLPVAVPAPVEKSAAVVHLHSEVQLDLFA